MLSNFEAYPTASSPVVYASRRTLPHAMQDSLPAGGCAFAGRESNSLYHYERFQFMASSSPGLTLGNRRVV